MQDIEGDVSFIQCDLTNLETVRSAAEELDKATDNLDILMNNAGGIVQKRHVTIDGFEETFQMNHLGHFLLTEMLIEKLKVSNARIINISSEAHRMGNPDFNDLNWKNRSYKGWQAYGDAKLFNIYFTKGLDSRYRENGISSFAVHPGVVNTNFGGGSSGLMKIGIKVLKPFMITPEKGAETQLFLAEEEGIEKHSGRYFVKKKVKSPSSLAREESLSEKLWEESMKMIQPLL